MYYIHYTWLVANYFRFFFITKELSNFKNKQYFHLAGRIIYFIYI